MDDKLKNSENEAQIIKHEDLARHNSKGIYIDLQSRVAEASSDHRGAATWSHLR